MTTLLTRHEQSALLIKDKNKILAIDFGSLTAGETIASLPKPDAVLVSHQHGDHFSLDHLHAFGAPVFAPEDVVSQLHNGMIATVLRPGETLDVAEFTVTPIEVDHGPKLSAPIENLGFVIQCPGGHVILFTGDIACPGNPPKGPFDTVVLPVGGAGFVFGTREALDFLNLIGHRGRVIPVHDTGPSDHGAADRFAQLAPPHLNVIALTPGASMEVLA